MDSGAEARISARLERMEEALTLLRLPPNLQCLRVKEVADLLRLSCQTVRRLIESGELSAKPVQGARRTLYLITVDNLERYLKGGNTGAKKKPPDDSDGLVEVPNVDI